MRACGLPGRSELDAPLAPSRTRAALHCFTLGALSRRVEAKVEFIANGISHTSERWAR